ncbi:hypothetical protein [Skermania piniformis]|uniref:H domain protein n=1 Tax=Skermania pinensis TaxID=39122 RepID=A0ABX8S6Q8_9ACTN|nr:hypothetical protein [Skermania piniformis]QXQ13507.1 h domain protein [Skermania piniformis]
MSRVGRALRKALPVLVVVVAVGLLGAAGVLGYRVWQDRAVEQARTEAMDAASKQAVAMLAYHAVNVETELPRAADGLTGGFKDDYAKLIKDVIIPGAKEKQLNVDVTVQGTGVVNAARNEVVVLLFIDQSTTGKDTPQAVVTGSRIRMTMQHVDGRWLAADLKPI